MDKYLPYTEEEFGELKSIISSISSHIPEDKMSWVWNNHNKILKTTEPQPCSCGSASKHWIRAVGTIRDFVQRKETL